MTDHDRPLPKPLRWRLDEIAWIEANLRPGEKLSDFLPPPSPPPSRRLPERPLFGDFRVKRWPLWAETLFFLLVVVAFPFAMSLAITVLVIGLPFWCIWRGWQWRHKPKPTPWAPPRVIPPYRKPLTLWEKADRFAP